MLLRKIIVIELFLQSKFAIAKAPFTGPDKDNDGTTI